MPKDNRDFAPDAGASEPGEMVDGTSSQGVSSGSVQALVDMVRPEDRAKEPVVAQVPASDVADWKKHGWAIKE